MKFFCQGQVVPLLLRVNELEILSDPSEIKYSHHPSTTIQMNFEILSDPLEVGRDPQ